MILKRLSKRVFVGSPSISRQSRHWRSVSFINQPQCNEGNSHHFIQMKAEFHLTNLVHPASCMALSIDCSSPPSLFSLMAVCPRSVTSVWTTSATAGCWCLMKNHSSHNHSQTHAVYLPSASVCPPSHIHAPSSILPHPLDPPRFAEAPACPGCTSGSLAPPCWMEEALNRLSKSNLLQIISVSLSLKATSSLLPTLHCCSFTVGLFSFLPVMAVDSDLKHSEAEFPTSVW